MILCILDFVQRHLVDFWKKSPANFNFIWLEWNSYNSSTQFHIVWSRTSIFKLKCSLDGGCYRWYWNFIPFRLYYSKIKMKSSEWCQSMLNDATRLWKWCNKWKKIFFGTKIMHGCVMWLHSAKYLKGSEVNFVTITPLISFINFNALHFGMWSWNVFVCLSQGYLYCQKNSKLKRSF